jgi:hypothetical protein
MNTAYSSLAVGLSYTYDSSAMVLNYLVKLA